MSVDLTEAERLVLERARRQWEIADSRHREYRDRWDRMFKLWAGYREVKSRTLAEPDRDVRAQQWREWGANLALPIAFTIVETVIPRALSQAPRMLVLPRSPEAEENVRNMRMLMDAQQSRIDYDLRLQDLFKNGAIGGLGVGKTGWKKEYRDVARVGRGVIHRWVSKTSKECVFDDPWMESVDPRDFLWDPFWDELERCDFVIHRVWRSHEYVLEQMRKPKEEGGWRQVDEVDVKSMASMVGYSEVNAQRFEALGHTNWTGRGGSETGVHELWEVHDRRKNRVVTILDRAVPVLDRENPAAHRDFPFQVFRPTKVPGQLAGMGEIEPLEHLIREMNTMRTQRLDNATVALMRSYAYDRNMIDRDVLKLGPGLAWPVDGPPSEALFALPIHDIPNSSFQEVAELKADIDRASGISDSVAGAEGGGTSETATGAQLVLAAANERIKLKRVRFEKEIIRAQARHWLAENQARIVGERDVRVPVEDPDPEKRWTWLKVGPAELAGEMEVEPEGGSTAPENTPQLRQDAQMLASFCQTNPMIRPDKWVPVVLEKLGIRDGESWLAPQEPQVPASVLEMLVQAGVSEELVAQAVEAVTAQEQGAQGGEGQGGGAQQPVEAPAGATGGGA